MAETPRARVAGVQHTSKLTADVLALTRARGYIRRDVPFRLSSGALSHDYVDMRHAVATGADLRLCAEAVIATLEEMGVAFDAIGGMTMGADPVSHAVALLASTSWFSVRKTEKDHGRANRIEGARLDSSSRVVLFEDTTTTGQSMLSALDAVHATGATVLVAMTLLDRGEQASEAFAERSVPYRALLSYRDLGIEPIGGAEGHAPA